MKTKTVFRKFPQGDIIKKTKQKILIYGDVTCRPGVANGSPCAFVGRSRTRFYPIGTPAKLAS